MVPNALALCKLEFSVLHVQSGRAEQGTLLLETGSGSPGKGKVVHFSFPAQPFLSFQEVPTKVPIIKVISIAQFSIPDHAPFSPACSV